jgi:hypothetical protein
MPSPSNFNSPSNLTFEQAKEVADRAVFDHSGRHLNDTEVSVLRHSWDRKTYEEMSQILHLSHSYLQADVGHHLWKKLSSALEERVSKLNFKEPLGRKAPNESCQSSSPTPKIDLTRPDGFVPLDSQTYLEREGVDSRCHGTVAQPGSLVRIKAPKFMGKTSLLMRAMDRAQSQNYRTAYLDLSTAEHGIINNLEKFLRWFCGKVVIELGLEDQITDYWDATILGSNDNCTGYFEEYLLRDIESPLVLGLDNVDSIFSHIEVVEDFLGMLRSWHENAKTKPLWKKLRIVMAHSTECYVPLDMNQSPFNAGVPIELKEFDHEQVRDLAQLYDLHWGDNEVKQLMKMVGGHPYLIGLALYEVGTKAIGLEQLLDKAPTEEGIYRNYLRSLLEILRQSPALAQAFKTVVASSVPTELDSMQIYKLHSMGLVKQNRNGVSPRCDMYRNHFCRVLSI